MKIRGDFKKILSYKILLPVVLLMVLLTIVMPRQGAFEYSYRKGAKWAYETLSAPFDFPILKTDEQLRTEKEKIGSTFIACYVEDPSVPHQVEEAISKAYKSCPSFAAAAISAVRKCYKRGVISSAQYFMGPGADRSDEYVCIYRTKRSSKVPRTEVYDNQQMQSRVYELLYSSLDRSSVDSLIVAGDMDKILQPNLIFDRDLTESLHRESQDFISPTSGVFKAGDLIVSTGEVITADIMQILDSYKAEYQNEVGYSGPVINLWLGNAMLSIILVLMLFLLIFFSRPQLLNNINQFTFVLTVFAISCICTFVFSGFFWKSCYLMPYPVFALYYMSFFRKKFTLPLYSISILPILIFIQNGSQVYFGQLFAGFCAVFAFDRFNKGWHQFISALIVFAAHLLTYFALLLFNGFESQFDQMQVLNMFLGSLFIVLAYPLVYLFEICFNLVSANRLMDLADTSQPLLRSLADKAPGTFQHSLSVMNLADEAARKIDADVLLVRAGALYHDVGKSLNPMCFVENQNNGINYHAQLSPKESAYDIIRHVTDGVQLAEKNGIPAVVRDFIITHHGTTCTGYFYNKYLNDGGDPSDVSAFFYSGPKPQTKEQVILMLADTVEAASRTLTDFSPESVSAFVDKIHSDKYHSGQYDDADITINEINTVIETLKNYLVQVHHNRIAYPKRKDNNNTNK